MIPIDENKIVRIEGKKLTIPRVLPFCERCMINPNFCEYEVKGFREPKKGEWYLSGATVKPYQAPNDLSGKYWVVEPTKKLKHKTVSVFVEV